MFNVAQPYRKQLIIDGDSLFARGNGNATAVFEAPIALYNALTGTRPPIFMYAVSGKSIAQLISDFPTKIAPFIKKGDIVVMNETTNSLNTLQSASLTFDDLLDYRDLVWGLGAKIVVGTMTARGTGYVGIETDRLALNTLITNNASEFDKVCDVGGLSEFNSVAATASTTYYDADTLHFKTAGYNLYGQTFASKVQELL